MSHTVTIETQIKDLAAIRAACQRLGLAQPVFGEAQLFSGAKTGWQVQLPGWRYPVVADVTSGELAFDNFAGHWGERRELDRFLQAYAIEVTRIEARKKGHLVTEQPLPDGSVKLTIQVQGGAA